MSAVRASAVTSPVTADGSAHWWKDGVEAVDEVSRVHIETTAQLDRLVVTLAWKPDVEDVELVDLFSARGRN